MKPNKEYYAHTLHDALYIFTEKKPPAVNCSFEKADIKTGAFLLCNQICTSIDNAITFYNKCEHTFNNLNNEVIVSV